MELAAKLLVTEEVYAELPRVVQIIKASEAGDDEPLHEYMKAVTTPFADHSDVNKRWLEPGPRDPRVGVELLSCSS